MTTIKHAMNHATNELYKVLIHMTQFSAKQFAMIQAIIAFFDALANDVSSIDAATLARYKAVANVKDIVITEETRKRFASRLYRRCEIFHASVAVDSERRCAVYYVTKNKALKTASSLYDLKRAKLAKNAATASQSEVSKEVATTQSDATDATQSTKKTKRAKRESKAKRENVSATDRAIDARNDALAVADAIDAKRDAEISAIDVM